MQLPFFPGPVFGWAYCVVLTGLLVLAAYIDWRKMLVPKTISLSLLVLGLLFNTIRGAWMGAAGLKVWQLEPNGALLGAADGLLFSLAGFGVGFGIFFCMWILGTCGGGDVKLFAALGSWVGGYFALLVLMGTVVVVLVLTVGKVVIALPTGGMRKLMQQRSQRRYHPRLHRPSAEQAPQRSRRRLITYSLPVALVTTFLLFWMLRVDLHLAAAPEAKPNNGESHAR